MELGEYCKPLVGTELVSVEKHAYSWSSGSEPGSQDRVEVVHFPNPGRFLVICGVLPHFVDGMVGYVRVNP